MKEIILLKNGELALKGLNRHTFENQLIKNMKFRLHDLGKIRYVSSQSTITVEPIDEDVDFLLGRENGGADPQRRAYNVLAQVHGFQNSALVSL